MGEWAAGDTGGRPALRDEEILYLSHDDIVRCAVTLEEITCAVEKAFRAKALGRAATNRKLTLPAGPEANFAGKGGILLDEGYAAVKWYGYIGNNARRGLPISARCSSSVRPRRGFRWLSSTAAGSPPSEQLPSRPPRRRYSPNPTAARPVSWLAAPRRKRTCGRCGRVSRSNGWSRIAATATPPSGSPRRLASWG